MVNFYNIFVFQNLLKDEAVFKNTIFPVPAVAILFPFWFPEPALTIPFPANKFPNTLAPKVPNKILKNRPFCSFV